MRDETQIATFAKMRRPIELRQRQSLPIASFNNRAWQSELQEVQKCVDCFSLR